MSCHSHFLAHALAVPFPEVQAYVILSMLDILKYWFPETLGKDMYFLKGLFTLHKIHNTVYLSPIVYLTS